MSRRRDVLQVGATWCVCIWSDNIVSRLTVVEDSGGTSSRISATSGASAPTLEHFDPHSGPGRFRHNTRGMYRLLLLKVTYVCYEVRDLYAVYRERAESTS